MSLREAYSATGAAWRDGPERVYERLAHVLVAASPVSLSGGVVVDVGAGAGAASRAIRRAGGRPVGVDAADGMLRVDQRQRPPGLVADARSLPFATGSCDAVVGAFCLNHLPDPEVALADAARVVRPGGVVLVSSYADGDAHPVQDAVDEAVRELGWFEEAWIGDLRSGSFPLLSSPERAVAVAGRAGLHASAKQISVPFADLEPADLVAWRLGMAQVAPFLATLPRGARQRVAARALHLLGPRPEPLVRQVVLLIVRT